MKGILRDETNMYALPPEAVPANMEAAYASALWNLDWQAAAWKLGATSENSRKELGLTKPIFGPLAPWEVAQGPCRLEISANLVVCAEAELLLRIGQTEYQVAETANLFDAWAWGLELPSSSISNLSELPPTALVLDRCAAFFLVVGRQYSMREAWNGDLLTITINGHEAVTGSLNNLAWAPEECARKFMEEAHSQGVILEPGQWIACGGLTPCVWLDAGEIVLFWGSEKVCEFELARRALI